VNSDKSKSFNLGQTIRNQRPAKKEMRHFCIEEKNA
jgi:hypothetical protein